MERQAKLSRKLASKALAIGSGKGGTGKSTTAVNLALYYAKRGIKIALFDLDPLSNIAIILDLVLPESVFKTSSLKQKKLSSYTIPVVPNLDLLFPGTKHSKGDSTVLLNLIFSDFTEELDKRYDFLILDLPAGIGNEENLAFLPFVNTLAVVTNPEPTAHVSSGGYIKAALEINPDLKICLWHNRYRVDPTLPFNTQDVAGNYNRFAPPELTLGEAEIEKIKSVGFVPFDRTLNLLLSDISPKEVLLYKTGESVRVLREQVVEKTYLPGGMDKVKHRLAKYFTRTDTTLGLMDGELSKSIAGYLERVCRSTLTEKELKSLEGFSTALYMNPLYPKISETLLGLEKALEESAAKGGLFSTGSKVLYNRPDQELSGLVRSLARSNLLSDPFFRNLAGLFLFNFSLYRLSAVPTVETLFKEFFPKRKTAQAGYVRNRHLQIRSFYEKDGDYHDKYYQLIKSLFPVALRQIDSIANALNCRNMLFIDTSGGLNRNIYLRFLMDLIHDTIHSGLGVFPGLRFNQASQALKKGAEELFLLARSG